MSFLNPALLAAGLAAVAIPIVIHILMRRRRRPVHWAAMRFLLEAYQKQRRRMTLEQILLLAARCLLVACVALALGLPVLGAGAAAPSGQRLLVLLVDNSLTGGLLDADGEPALERHKRAGLEALEALDPARGDRAALIALGGPAEPLVLPPTADIDGLRSVLRGLEATDSRADFAGAVEAARSAAGEGESALRPALLVLSDFRAGSAATDRPLPSLVSAGAEGGMGSAGGGGGGGGVGAWSVVASRPAGDARANVAVEALEPLRSLVVAGAAPGAGQVLVRLVRTGGVLEAESTRVRLFLDDPGTAPTPTPVVETVVRWQAGAETATASVNMPLRDAPGRSDLRLVRAEIDRDALPADNVRFGGLEVRRSLRVGIVARGRFGRRVGIADYAPLDWARLALAPGEETEAGGIGLVQIEPTALDAGRLAQLDAVVVLEPAALAPAAWDRLGDFVGSGRLLAVFPDAEAEAQAWTDQLERVAGIGLGAAPETAAYAEPRALEPGMGAGVGVGSRASLLGMLSGELEQLARPVGVSRQLPLNTGTARGLTEAALPAEGGGPLLAVYRPEREGGAAAPGLVVVFTVALDVGWTDLPTRPLMVPLLQEVVRQGVAVARPDTATVAGRSPETPPGAAELTPAGASGGARAIPLREGRAPALRRAGPLIARDARGAEAGLVLVHPDLEASRTRPLSEEEIAGWLAPAAGLDASRVRWIGGEEAGEASEALRAAGAGGDERAPLAWPFVLGALALAVAEMFLARLGSHAEAPRAEGRGA